MIVYMEGKIQNPKFFKNLFLGLEEVEVNVNILHYKGGECFIPN